MSVVGSTQQALLEDEPSYDGQTLDCFKDRRTAVDLKLWRELRLLRVASVAVTDCGAHHKSSISRVRKVVVKVDMYVIALVGSTGSGGQVDVWVGG